MNLYITLLLGTDAMAPEKMARGSDRWISMFDKNSHRELQFT
jgi:hypothetical protein